jgi:hypothetical protein
MAEVYTPPNAAYSNANQNAPESNYASAYSHETTNLMSQIYNRLIFDTQPKQYLDLAVLGMRARQQVKSDEFEYAEMGYGRQGIVANAGVGECVAGATQVVTTGDTSGVSLDTVLNYPNDKKGVVISITKDTSVTVKPMTGDTLPAVVTADILTHLSPVERDAVADIKSYWRASTITRYNYVQLVARAMRFGKMEYWKYQNSGTFDNYLTLNRQQFIQQFQEDWSNIFWMGTRGEVTLTDTEQAKMAGGVYWSMINAGSTVVSCTSSTIGDVLEATAMETSYKVLGARRMLFATPENILKLYKYYKAELVRYTNAETNINLDLKVITLPSDEIVLCPMPRFKNTSSFPVDWQKKMFLIDMESINPKYAFPDEYGQTQMRGEVGGDLKTYRDEFASTTFSLQYVNPLGGAIITVD